MKAMEECLRVMQDVQRMAQDWVNSLDAEAPLCKSKDERELIELYRTATPKDREHIKVLTAAFAAKQINHLNTVIAKVEKIREAA